MIARSASFFMIATVAMVKISSLPCSAMVATQEAMSSASSPNLALLAAGLLNENSDDSAYPSMKSAYSFGARVRKCSNKKRKSIS